MKGIRAKRASYKEAVEWIALNDESGTADRLDPNVVSELVTCCLIADIFGVPVEKVGADVVRVRTENDWLVRQARKITDKSGS